MRKLIVLSLVVMLSGCAGYNVRFFPVEESKQGMISNNSIAESSTNEQDNERGYGHGKGHDKGHGKGHDKGHGRGHGKH